MSKLKKGIALLTSFGLVASLSVAGTLAYLTDRDSEANVFTVGDVSIDLNEDFDQGAILNPGVDIEKKPTITNTGKNDAWVWATIAIPALLDKDDASQNVVHFNYESDFVSEEKWTWTDSDNKWMLQKDVEIEGETNKYNIYTVMYQTALKPGDETEPVMTNVYMDTNVDIDPNGDWYTVENGVATKLEWNTTTNGNPIMYVSAYAIQTEGFATVQEAYEAYNAQWGENGTEYATPATTVANADEFVGALENGEDVIMTSDIIIDPANMSNAYGTTGINVKNGQTIDGGGNTLAIKGADGTWDSGINTTGGTIKNLSVTGSFRGIFINHNAEHSERVILENVIIDGTTYTISCDQGKFQGLTATDSTFNGWTSYAATLGDAEFIGCNFGEGSGYAFCRPYAPTSFVGCEFETGYEIDPRAAVTFENCTLNGVALTEENLETLVTSNIANATVK